MKMILIENSSPTNEQFVRYQEAYNYFNRKLFNGELSPCLLNFSRLKGALGFFAYKRWLNNESGDYTHEISLNPDLLPRPMDEIMAVLVHEMAHQWQFDCGKPSGRGYHNKQWTGKMESIGLVPSSTGQPGGKKTGYRMAHYIPKDGRFAKVFSEMPQDFLLPWTGIPLTTSRGNAKPRQDKLKYSCPKCLTNVWGKHDLNIFCGNCLSKYRTN